MSNITITRWKNAAIKAFNKWNLEYDDSIDRNNAAILDVKNAGKTLPEHFWQNQHKAFIRRESARQLLELILEVEKQYNLEEEQRKKRSDLGLDITTTHSDIRT